MMTFDTEKLLDATGWQILQALQENARTSFTELGRRVGLTAPAVAERVRRLEEAGVISGYHAQINTEKIGLPLSAYIRVSLSHERKVLLSALAKDLPEVLECHSLTGDDCLIMRVVVSSVAHLEELLHRLGQFGRTTTSLVLSSPVTRRTLENRQWPGDSEAEAV